MKCGNCKTELKQENKYREGFYNSVYECPNCGKLNYFYREEIE
jgi:predicted RNA-binding Zn-ribbon protein involved in translation (DUF1610 family)